MSNNREGDEVTVYETKPRESVGDTARAEALRVIARKASEWREWARDYAEDGHSEAANFKQAVADELQRAQDWLAAQEASGPSLREQAMVQAFHRLVGATVGDMAYPRAEGWTLRFRLMQEELDELIDSDLHGNMAEVAKELADLLYVVLGTAVTFGIDLGPVFDEVHASNMTKTGGEKRADGKAMKGPNYRPPDIAAVLVRQRRAAR